MTCWNEDQKLCSRREGYVSIVCGIRRILPPVPRTNIYLPGWRLKRILQRCKNTKGVQNGNGTQRATIHDQDQSLYSICNMPNWFSMKICSSFVKDWRVCNNNWRLVETFPNDSKTNCVSDGICAGEHNISLFCPALVRTISLEFIL